MRNYKITLRGKIFFLLVFFILLFSFFLNRTLFIGSFAILGLLLIAQLFSIKKQKKESMKQKTKISVSANKDLLEKEKQSFKKQFNKKKPKKEKIKINNIEDYFKEKKETIDKYYENKKDNYIYEQEDDILKSIVDSFIEQFKKVKKLISLKKYKNGEYVLHNEFGVGKVIKTDPYLEVSFKNQNYNENIVFEYNSKKRVPELSKFNVPKGEKIESFFYDYTKDINPEVKEMVQKVKFSDSNIKSFPNILLNINDKSSLYDLILVKDKLYIYDLVQNSDLELIKKLLKEYDLDLEVKKAPKKDIESLKEKSLISKEKLRIVEKLLTLNNVIDYKKRKKLIDF